MEEIEHVELTKVDEDYLRKSELEEKVDRSKPIYFRKMEHDVKVTFEEIGLGDNTRKVDWERHDVNIRLRKNSRKLTA